MNAILLLCVVGFVAAQQPQPCVTPQQWEANLFDYSEPNRFMVRGRLSYDATNHRERLLEEVEVGNDREYYDVIALFDLQTEFIYNYKAHNCSRQPLTRPWRDFGIRPDARSFGEAYIGTSALPGLGLLVTMWGTNHTTPSNDTVRTFGTWTYRACLPVSFISHSTQMGRTQSSFFDIVAGISDPNVFIPRPECLTAKEYAMRDTIFGTPAKKFTK
ncbi:unnamed protein product [Rotaria magnacalcarata]|uniref:Mammalian ependymin-related protein 1 n=2 Tax=Rotaria magnacalcarata TaxID=392030 RepID=A0A816U5W9_9BILA|nr:unnamed protein product [Rotaria magnacalcarata]CAF1685992.1 unnamed protein product [Rotaria magnacalcarata]CAF2060253.1 unnamed protein product [Rotaria magnacalcarata]CAF2105119.1 unnamed protein product [Rotaria magnacalcarata]CAF2163276.1 unnamed protein product [Rotaria magnacalcarata]